MTALVDPLRCLPVQLLDTEDGVLLKRGCVELHVAGAEASQVVAAIVGTTVRAPTTRADLIGSFPAPVRDAVGALIDRLVDRRILVVAGEPGDHATNGETRRDVFYWDLGRSRGEVEQQLATYPIIVVGVNAIARRLVEVLTAAGARAVEVVDYPALRNLEEFGLGDEPDLTAWTGPLPIAYPTWVETFAVPSTGCVVATSDAGGVSLLREWNQLCIDNELRFLPVVLQNLVGYIGPLVIPGVTACYECLLARQNANRADFALGRQFEDGALAGQEVASLHHAVAAAVAEHAAIELIKQAAGLPMAQIGKLIELRPLVPALTIRSILRIPRCVACSTMNTISQLAVDRVSLQEPSPRETAS